MSLMPIQGYVAATLANCSRTRALGSLIPFPFRKLILSNEEHRAAFCLLSMGAAPGYLLLHGPQSNIKVLVELHFQLAEA
jgi:hypothetical protein